MFGSVLRSIHKSSFLKLYLNQAKGRKRMAFENGMMDELEALGKLAKFWKNHLIEPFGLCTGIFTNVESHDK